MWVARDKDNTLHLFTIRKPYCENGYWSNYTDFEEFSVKLDSSLFPKLTWKHKPIEVELNTKGLLDTIYEDLQDVARLIR